MGLSPSPHTSGVQGYYFYVPHIVWVDGAGGEEERHMDMHCHFVLGKRDEVTGMLFLLPKRGK